MDILSFPSRVEPDGTLTIQFPVLEVNVDPRILIFLSDAFESKDEEYTGRAETVIHAFCGSSVEDINISLKNFLDMKNERDKVLGEDNEERDYLRAKSLIEQMLQASNPEVERTALEERVFSEAAERPKINSGRAFLWSVALTLSLGFMFMVDGDTRMTLIGIAAALIMFRDYIIRESDDKSNPQEEE